MMDEVQMDVVCYQDLVVTAIVQFGPATSTSGFRAGEYYQVTIDPNMASPNGKFIRFGLYPGDEINGWQRIEAMTIAESLSASDPVGPPGKPAGYKIEKGAAVYFRTIKQPE